MPLLPGRGGCPGFPGEDGATRWVFQTRPPWEFSDAGCLVSSPRGAGALAREVAPRRCEGRSLCRFGPHRWGPALSVSALKRVYTASILSRCGGLDSLLRGRAPHGRSVSADARSSTAGWTQEPIKLCRSARRCKTFLRTSRSVKGVRWFRCARRPPLSACRGSSSWRALAPFRQGTTPQCRSADCGTSRRDPSSRLLVVSVLTTGAAGCTPTMP